MRVTPLRWFLAAVLTGLFVIVVVLPNRPITEMLGYVGRPSLVKPDSEFVRLARRATHEMRVEQRLAAELIRARAVAAMHAAPMTATVLPDDVSYRAAMTWHDPAVDSAVIRRALEAPTLYQIADSMRTLHERFTTGSLGDIRTAVLLVPADSVSSTPFESFSGWVVMPAGLDERSCVLVYTGILLRNSAANGNLLGPCFWFGAFGAPGRGAREWINSTGLEGSGWFMSPRRRAEVARLEAMRRPPERQAQWFAELFAPTAYGTNIIQCIARGGEACSSNLSRPYMARYSNRSDPRARANIFGIQSTFDYGSLVIPAELYREFGAEKFAKLWRSPLPFDESFAHATGEDLREYIRRRATTTVGMNYVPGPWLPTWTTVITLLTITTALAVTITTARRPAAL
jgi:hypothetical protein